MPYDLDGCLEKEERRVAGEIDASLWSADTTGRWPTTFACALRSGATCSLRCGSVRAAV